MSRRDGFIIHCCLCKKLFDSAASLLIHLSKHAKNTNEDSDETSEPKSYLGPVSPCNLSCNNNCMMDEQNVSSNSESGRSENYNVSVHPCHDSFSSNSSHVSQIIVDNNKCDVNATIFSSSIKYNNISNDKMTNKTTDDSDCIPNESFDELDPSEYCVTMIEEQENSDINHSTHLIPCNKNNSPSLRISKPSYRRKYACRLCSKIFGWSTDLKRHILIHTGERPYKCESCNASFTRNFLLQKHLSKVHPCHISKETLKYLEEGVELNLKLLKESMNIPKNVQTNV